MPVLDPQALIDNRVEALRDYHAAAGVTMAEIDVSGGVDSAILVMLLARALNPENVIAVHSGINTDPAQTARAHEACEAAGVKLIEIDLTHIYNNLTGLMRRAVRAAHGTNTLTTRLMASRVAADPTILGSIRSTLRAPVGRGFNRMMGGGIRHGTGNECEDRWTRFFQKGGDGEVDTNPIAMLSKAETYQLAFALGVPKSIITAAPSPDLWGEGDGHNDEDEYANYFGFAAAEYGQTFYGYIDPETGVYTKVGLIERVSRFLDGDWSDLIQAGLMVLNLDGRTVGGALFSPIDHFETRIGGVDGFITGMAEIAAQRPSFKDIDPELIFLVLKAARKIERQTRHKMNPNCPTLGDRADLLEADILTDDLPEL